MKTIKMSDIFTDEMVHGGYTFFKYLQLYDAGLTTPLLDGFLDATNYFTFDYDYLFGNSNEKYISRLTFKDLVGALEHESLTLEDFFNGLTTSQQQDIIGDMFNTAIGGMMTKIIHQRFAVKWKKIYDALMTTYNPLENYDMEQTETPGITKTTNISSKITTERKGDITDSSIYGFNSGTQNPSGQVESNGETIVSGNANDNVSTETETGTRGLTRHGNIGVTTSQQMLQSEFEVRKYDFYKMIYSDIDSILCLKTY